MIGFFVFEETPTLEKPLSLAHSALKTEIKGLFYVRSLDCKDIGGGWKISAMTRSEPLWASPPRTFQSVFSE